MSLLDKTERQSEHFQRRLHQLTFFKSKQIAFLQDLVNLLSYVGSPMQILETIKQHSPSDKKALAYDLIKELRAGRKLADGMVGWFDPTLIHATRIGEEQGVLADSLQPALDMMSKETKQLGAAMKHFIMPLVYTLIVLFIWAQLRTDFLPVLIKIVKGDITQLPLDTASLFGAIDWTFRFGWVIPIAMLSLFFGMRFILRKYTGTYRDMLDKWPIFQQYAYFHGAEFIRIYAILKKVQLSEMEIIALAKEGANPYYKAHLLKYQTRLREGEANMGQVMSSTLFSADLIARLTLLSGSNHFIEAMSFASNQTNERLFNSINTFARLLGGMWLFLVMILIIITVQGLVNSNQIGF
jgi:type II secretory pathway component PulF